jgi:hypothetical protein
MRQAGLASQAPDLGHLRALYTATWAAPEATISAAASVAVTWPAWADNISFARRGFTATATGARITHQTLCRRTATPAEAAGSRLSLFTRTRGIEVTTRDPQQPIESEFNDLNANLVAPRCPLPIISVVRSSFGRKKDIQFSATKELT